MDYQQPAKYQEFEQLMTLFDVFWRHYFEGKWPFQQLAGSDQREFRSDAKLLFYLFFLWLDSEGGRLYLPGCIPRTRTTHPKDSTLETRF